MNNISTISRQVWLELFLNKLHHNQPHYAIIHVLKIKIKLPRQWIVPLIFAWYWMNRMPSTGWSVTVTSFTDGDSFNPALTSDSNISTYSNITSWTWSNRRVPHWFTVHRLRSGSCTRLIVPQTQLSTIGDQSCLSHVHGTVFLPTSLSKLLCCPPRDNLKHFTYQIFPITLNRFL